ncbi:MAG TPA: hypothetical protein VNQ73_01265 [Ilumatobacter sp.]|nr:hypothetical protein [Ilumatobacter sp.]
MSGRRGAGRWVIPAMLLVTVFVVVLAFVFDGRSTGEPDAHEAPIETGSTAPAAPGSDAPDNDSVTAPSDQFPPPSETTAADTAASGADSLFLARLHSMVGVPTAEERALLRSANTPQEEIARCMADAGFQYVEDRTDEWPEANHPQFTLSAEEYAAQYGFGAAAYALDLFPTPPFDANWDHRASLSEGQRNAWFAAEHACVTADVLVGEGDAWTVAVGQFRDALAADDRVVAAVAEWRGCMAAAGFQYDHPDRVADEFWNRHSQWITRDDARKMLAEEIPIAMAHVSCVVPYQATWREVVDDRVEEFRGLFDAALASGAAPEAAG